MLLINRENQIFLKLSEYIQKLRLNTQYDQIFLQWIDSSQKKRLISQKDSISWLEDLRR